jgi:O-antigen/teichoic acid export membrane protein
MGIIARQTIKGTIWSYFGVIIGFVTTAYLFPNYLTPEVVGLFGLLVSLSTLMGQLSLLGLPGVTNRMFAYFRNKENGHNGFLTIALLFHLAGVVIFLGTYFALKPWLIKTNIDDSPLFTQYMYLLVPMTLAMMLFTFLDVFNKVLYNAVFGTFLQEFFQRLMILGVTLLFVFKIINLEQLIIGYAVAVSVKALIIVFFLIKQKAINFKLPDKHVANKPMRREIASVAMFSLIGGLGSMIVFKLDKIIINQMLDLSNTGVYTIAFYFGSWVILPSRPLLKISGTLIADAWKKNDLKTIKDIYYKSCLNQLIIGGFLFLGIWANIDNILIILGDDYSGAKWVIFFIGLGYLIDMATGANAHVLVFSKYYRVNLIFISGLIVLVIALMYLLIPLWGIVGAAIAIALSLMLNNLMRYIFLFWKYRLQPFNWRFLLIIVFYSLSYLAVTFFPKMSLIPDILVRSGIIVILSLGFFWFVPISADIQKITAWMKNKLR